MCDGNEGKKEKENTKESNRLISTKNNFEVSTCF